MKISKYIQKLQSLQDRYGGDIDVIQRVSIPYSDYAHVSAPAPKIGTPKTNPVVYII